MTRIAMIVGLLALFALSYSGIEQLAVSESKAQATLAARRGARLAATTVELGWSSRIVELRAVALAAAAEVARRWPNAEQEIDPEQLRAQLQSVQDSAGGRETVALIAADRRRLGSVAPPGGADIDPAARAINDARAGVLTVQLAGSAAAPALVAAAPAGGDRVIAVWSPIDHKAVLAWAQGEELAALVARSGELVGGTVESGLPARVALDADTIEVRGQPANLAIRPLSDDTGVVLHAVGMSALGSPGSALALEHLQRVFGVLAALAILIAILGTLTPARVVEVVRAGQPARQTPAPVPPQPVAPVPLAPPAPAPTAPAPAPVPITPTAADAAWRSLATENSTTRSVPPDALRARPPIDPGFAPAAPAPRSDAEPTLTSRPQPSAPRYSVPAPAPAPTAPAPPRPASAMRSIEPPRSTGRSSLPAPARASFPTPSGLPSPSGLPAPASLPAASGLPSPASLSGRPQVPPVSSGMLPSLARGMSPAPPSLMSGTPRYNSLPPGYAPSGTYAGYTPLPVLEEDPDYIAATRGSGIGSGIGPAMPTPLDGGGRRAGDGGTSAGPRAFDEEHYRASFDEFVGSKRRLGESVEAVSFEGFKAKLRKIEQTLIDKHACKAVRFQVIVKDRQVSLRPQLVR